MYAITVYCYFRFCFCSYRISGENNRGHLKFSSYTRNTALRTWWNLHDIMAVFKIVFSKFSFDLMRVKYVLAPQNRTEFPDTRFTVSCFLVVHKYRISTGTCFSSWNALKPFADNFVKKRFAIAYTTWIKTVSTHQRFTPTLYSRRGPSSAKERFFFFIYNRNTDTRRRIREKRYRNVSC